MSTENTQLAPKEEASLGSVMPEMLGFEEANAEDLVVPRIKVVNAMTPERKEKKADEGDIINTLTCEKLNNKRFIPIKVFYSNIYWNPDRADKDNRMLCRSHNGVAAEDCEGNSLFCAACKKHKFDNTKRGKDAAPLCTAYLNFLGFFEDDAMPVVVSFAKTNYNEGKKFLSLAKSLRRSIWDFAYTFDGKEVKKNDNSWFNIEVTLAGETTAEERVIATQLYLAWKEQQVKSNFDEEESTKQSVVITPEDAEEI